MKTKTPDSPAEIDYAAAAERYLQSLTLEHFMESTPHATQRKITLESFDVVHKYRPDVQLFNELLVQYPLGTVPGKLGQVVPDNMVVIHDQPIEAIGSFDTPRQPSLPYWVLEYVSRGSRRKDYKDNRRRYEHELQVPYYLLFDPKKLKLTLLHLGERKRYQQVKANRHGRFEIPELEMEVALHNEWVRFWFRGELVPLTPDLLAEVDQMREQLAAEKSRADQAEKQREQAEKQREQAEKQREQAEKQREQAEKQLEDAVRENQRLRALLKQKGTLPPD